MSIDYAEAARLIRKGRDAEKRGKAFRGCLGGFVWVQLNNLYCGWMLMLAVGIAHAEWIPTLPTIGYWWAVLLVVLTRGLFTAVPKPKSDK